PGDGDDAPRRLIPDDAVGDQCPDTVDREVTQADVLDKRGIEREKEPKGNRELIALDQVEPIIPRFLVSIAIRTCLEPGGEGQVEAFYSRPIEERPRIKENDQGGAGRYDHEENQIRPRLLHGPRIWHSIQKVRHPGDEYRDDRAAEVDNVS